MASCHNVLLSQSPLTDSWTIWILRFANSYDILPLEWDPYIEIKLSCMHLIKSAANLLLRFILLHKTFAANTDRYTVVGHNLDPPIRARYLRIIPEEWQTYIALRAEFYGCKTSKYGMCDNLPDRKKGVAKWVKHIIISPLPQGNFLTSLAGSIKHTLHTTMTSYTLFLVPSH